MLLGRVQEAIAEGNLRRASMEAHSMRGMALYIGSPPVALASQALEVAAAAKDADEVAQRAAWLEREVLGLSASPVHAMQSVPAATDAVGESATPEAHAEAMINALSRRNIQYALERLSVAASRGDIQSLRSGALALKQMTLCHGQAFDLLAIAAYQLQQAATAGLSPMAFVPPVIEAGSHMVQLLLLETASPSSLSSIRQVVGCSFFSHVICIRPGLYRSHEMADGNGSRTLTPPVTEAGMDNFSGDKVVYAQAAAAFCQLFPIWYRSAANALTESHLVLLKSECWVLHSVAHLVGADRLAQLASDLQQLVSSPHPLSVMHRALQSLRAEARLVIAYFGQNTPHRWQRDRARLAEAGSTSRIPALPAMLPRPGASAEHVPDDISAAITTDAAVTESLGGAEARPPRDASPYAFPSPASQLRSPDSARGGKQSAGSPSLRSYHVAILPLRVVRFLLEATQDLSALAIAGVKGEAPASERDWAVAAETAETAAAAVDDLLTRASRRESLLQLNT